jgi:lipopolysaccharide export system protein LptA
VHVEKYQSYLPDKGISKGDKLTLDIRKGEARARGDNGVRISTGL